MRTETKMAEAARATNLYQRMIEEIQDYAIIILDEKGIIQNWNKGAQSIKGYTEQEIVGRHFSVFYFEEDLETSLPQRLLQIAEREGRAVNEGWRRRKDNTRFWGSITITAVHDDHNNVIGYCKVTRDLSDKKAADEQIKAYNAELEMQNKELEQFAYIASHDLQEPLRKIQTFAGIIQEHIDDKDFVKRYFSKLDASAHRMAELVRSLLEYSRLSKYRSDVTDRQAVDLNEVLADIKQDFELLIGDKKASIVSEYLPVVIGRRIQLGQLFANLISNSLKFCMKDPVIKISSKTVNKDKIAQAPETLADGKYYSISFEDNGIGFEQQYDKVIFALFQRLHGKQDYAGTGIGLALCKKIVENHKGFISASGKPGQGAKFTVYLPVAV
ncbi:MAG: PAS domain S-box protein [Bacteroidia bacterium]|nr:PAS domain S-box protein [Bacteroidia bacterium]